MPKKQDRLLRVGVLGCGPIAQAAHFESCTKARNAELFAMGVPCFAAGTLIRTERGEVRVEALVPGNRVVTADNGLQPVRWVGVRRLDAGVLDQHPALRPVRIRRGVLGAGLPVADLVVSPQHRVLVRSANSAEVAGPAARA